MKAQDTSSHKILIQTMQQYTVAWNHSRWPFCEHYRTTSDM